jgi:hypothetical protein
VAHRLGVCSPQLLMGPDTTVTPAVVDSLAELPPEGRERVLAEHLQSSCWHWSSRMGHAQA